eukprot:1152607-Pelagomonas_calceolata.AAC.3
MLARSAVGQLNVGDVAAGIVNVHGNECRNQMPEKQTQTNRRRSVTTSIWLRGIWTIIAHSHRHGSTAVKCKFQKCMVIRLPGHLEGMGLAASVSAAFVSCTLARTHRLALFHAHWLVHIDLPFVGFLPNWCTRTKQASSLFLQISYSPLFPEALIEGLPLSAFATRQYCSTASIMRNAAELALQVPELLSDMHGHATLPYNRLIAHYLWSSGATTRAWVTHSCASCVRMAWAACSGVPPPPLCAPWL